jgi:apolipoprotein N-acyltransferase
VEGIPRPNLIAERQITLSSTTAKALSRSLGWKQSFVNLALAVVCFNLAYISHWAAAAGLLIFGYAYFLIQLTDQPSVRRAFYFGLAVGFGCAAGQAFFFWNIFSAAAVVLWLVFGFWIGLFTAISCGSIRRLGKATTVWLVPVIWTGTEYFRSELYYLRFSWLNIGYAFSGFLDAPFNEIGMYGVGFVAVSIASVLCFRDAVGKAQFGAFFLGMSALLLLLCFVPNTTAPKSDRSVKIAGVQMEFPMARVIPEILNEALAKNTNAAVFVLSEYTLDGGPPDLLKDWCKKHSRFLVVGGKDIVTNEIYFDTVFVIGTNGETVFKQAKCVPIQLFKDGLPATRQDLWNSPWGKIGFCICYDASYTRVTDVLVRQGAQMLIVPSMDVESWGRHEHELHSRVAPVRAAEYGLPIFRVASSGISQAVTEQGRVIARTSVPGNGDIFSAQMELPSHGSIPIDRGIAPFCVIVTGVITAGLLLATWVEKRSVEKVSAAKKEARAIV